MAKKGSLKRDVAAGTRWVFVAALLAMLMVGAGHAQTVYAANITVTKTEDTNGVCDPADCSLREAIAAANPGDTIDIPAGLFTVQSSLIISMDLTLTGVGASQTVIQADASPNVANYGVFMVMGGNVSISNVTIRHGGGLVGGGVNIMGNPFSTSLTITESIVSDNSAITGGAGIANAAILNIISSDISDNHTTAPFALGGGVFNFGTLNILNSTIAGNQADFGGGIFVSFGDVAITNSTLRDNQAVDGAGIYNEFSVLNVTNSTVSGNTAVTSGGGVFNTSIGTVNLNNATIAFNIAYDGGGVFNGFGGPVHHPELHHRRKRRRRRPARLCRPHDLSGLQPPSERIRLCHPGRQRHCNHRRPTAWPASEQRRADRYSCVGPVQSRDGRWQPWRL